MPVDAGRRIGETIGDVVDLDEGHDSVRHDRPALCENGGGPTRDGVGDERRSVRLRAAPCDEEVPRLDGARVVPHAAHAHVLVADDVDVAGNFAGNLG